MTAKNFTKYTARPARELEQMAASLAFNANQQKTRKKRHEAEKCISLLGAGGRHPEGRYGGTKVFPKAGDHFSSKRLRVEAEEGKKEEA